MNTQTLFLFLTFFALTLPTNAQYQPTTIEGANWIIYEYDDSAATPHGQANHHVINISGDTIINSINYKKVHRREIDSDVTLPQDLLPPYLVTPKELIGFIRDDTTAERVYFLDAVSFFCSEQEYILHDFSLNEDDPFEGCNLDPLFVVDLIGQETIWGQNRQVFLAVDANYKFIEGIGGRRGLFSDASIFVPGFYQVMVDYCTRGMENCEQILVSTSEDARIDQLKLEVFPNPVKNVLTIKLPDHHTYFDCSIEIFNTTGQVLLQKRLSQSDNSIDVSSLPAGMYHYRINNEIEYVNSGFMIKV